MIVAHHYDHVVGVDTHARTHTYAVVATKTGEILGTKAFPVTTAAIDRAIAWARDLAGGLVLFAIEGTGSYGASLGRALKRAEIAFCEVRPPKKSSRVRGKTDEIDAIAAATSAMGIELDALIRPKVDGLRNALRVTLDARRDMEIRRTSARNQLNALVRTADFGLDTRRALTDRGVQKLADLDAHHDNVAQRIIRGEAIRLASTVIELGRQMRENREALAELVELLAPGVQQIYGVGPVTAAVTVAAYSHPGRVRNEAAFASLAGVSPIPEAGTRHRRRSLSKSTMPMRRAVGRGSGFCGANRSDSNIEFGPSVTARRRAVPARMRPTAPPRLEKTPPALDDPTSLPGIRPVVSRSGDLTPHRSDI